MLYLFVFLFTVEMVMGLSVLSDILEIAQGTSLPNKAY